MNDLSYEASLRARYDEVSERLGVPPRRVVILSMIRDAGAEKVLAPAKVPNIIKKPSKLSRDWLLVGPTPKMEAAPPIPEHLPKQTIIMIEVARKYGVKLPEMRSTRRDKNLVNARYEAMWRIRNETSFSFPQIGRFFGGRDHTTVLHGIRRHEQRIASGEA